MKKPEQLIGELAESVKEYVQQVLELNNGQIDRARFITYDGEYLSDTEDTGVPADVHYGRRPDDTIYCLTEGDYTDLHDVDSPKDEDGDMDLDSKEYQEWMEGAVESWVHDAIEQDWFVDAAKEWWESHKVTVVDPSHYWDYYWDGDDAETTKDRIAALYELLRRCKEKWGSVPMVLAKSEWQTARAAGWVQHTISPAVEDYDTWGVPLPESQDQEILMAMRDELEREDQEETSPVSETGE